MSDFMVDVWRSFHSGRDSDGNSSDHSMEVTGNVSEDDEMGDTAWTNNEMFVNDVWNVNEPESTSGWMITAKKSSTNASALRYTLRTSCEQRDRLSSASSMGRPAQQIAGS